MSPIRHLPVIIALGLLSCACAQAATLAIYDINDSGFTATTTAFTPSTSSSGLTAGSATFGSFGGVTQGSTSYFRSAANGDGSTANLAFRVLENVGTSPSRVLTDSQAQAVTANSFVQFTVTPTGGQVLNLSSFSAFVASDALSASQTFGTTYFVRSSLDNYTANLGTVTVNTTVGNLTSGTLTADLSGSGFQSISSSFTLRIYAYANLGASTAAANMVGRVDTLTLQGTVSAAAIPEPSSYTLLLGLAGMLFAANRMGRPRQACKIG
ncbi:MAG: hypothetical protein WC205_08605 [Opitutaceae bacterium]|jgi:hypothetical protein